MRLKDKIGIVTAAGSGMGRAGAKLAAAISDGRSFHRIALQWLGLVRSQVRGVNLLAK